MPYMSDIVELLEFCEPYLHRLSDLLENDDVILNAIIKDVEMLLKEYEALQIGHMVRQ